MTDRISMTSEQALAFERCTDFLARMIIKYGGELELPPIERSQEVATSSETGKEYIPAA